MRQKLLSSKAKNRKISKPKTAPCLKAEDRHEILARCKLMNNDLIRFKILAMHKQGF
jgi:hypothetical protein